MAALLLIDIQNDFCPPSGALAVPGGTEVVAVANSLRASGRFAHIILTQDWHPKNHASFASTSGAAPFSNVKLVNPKTGEEYDQIVWPDHCVQGSEGSEFCKELVRAPTDIVVQKGTNPVVDSYSGFFDNAKIQSTGLGGLLQEKSISSVCVVGLATDFCVNFTVLDAVDEGLSTSVVLEGCRGIDPKGCDNAIAEWKKKGVRIYDTVEDFLKEQ